MKNKNPLVSVIVPTKNSANTLGACLRSIRTQTYKNIEIIVIDNNSSDITKSIASEYTRQVFNKGPERSAQRNFGASKSEGDYLLFIDSDMELSTTVVKESVEKINGFKALIIPEESFGENFWAKCKALERSFYIGVDWIEAARFFDRKTFQEFKGYDESQTGTEDYDLPQRIKGKYGKKSISRISSFIRHNEGKLSLIYTLKKKFYYVGTANKYLKNKTNSSYFKLQASPFARYKLFLSKPGKIFRNPIVGIGMLTMKTLEFAAGGLGYITHS